MIELVFADGASTICRSSANLISGITAEFAMHSTLTGRPKCQFAVIECDEAASKTVLKYLKPEVIVATNVFRDQLDRYGEITHTLNNIIEGICHTPESTLCINADCSLIASIPEHVPNPVVRFGVNVPLGGDDLTEISDAPHCIHCKTEYVYDYRTYGHLGAFRCPKCGYHREDPQVAVTAVQDLGVDTSDVTMSIGGQEYAVHINLRRQHNIYNAVGVGGCAVRISASPPRRSLRARRVRLRLGPYGELTCSGTPGRMMLARGRQLQTMRYLAGLNEDATFVVCLNDRDADGTDIVDLGRGL